MIRTTVHSDPLTPDWQFYGRACYYSCCAPTARASSVRMHATTLLDPLRFATTCVVAEHACGPNIFELLQTAIYPMCWVSAGFFNL